jgi:hypothetical protein
MWAAGLTLRSPWTTWLAVCLTGAIGALLKELITSAKRYNRSKIPPWREPGEDGSSTSGLVGYLALIVAQVVIGAGAAITVALLPLILAAGTAGLGGSYVLTKFMDRDRD